MTVMELLHFLRDAERRATVSVNIDGNSYTVVDVDIDTDGTVILKVEE